MEETTKTIYDMVDEIAQTEEDVFSGKFCKCGHLLSIHCAGKCYSFNFDGASFWSCHCKQAISAKFEIKVEVYADISANDSGESSIITEEI